MKPNGHIGQEERIVLFRGGALVSSYLGAFGTSLRETRLTAALGHLISQNPNPFLRLFRINSSISTVSLENHQESGRTDIEIVAGGKSYIVEAKRDFTDPSKQAARYKASGRILLTRYPAHTSHKEKLRTRYVTWQEIAAVLEELKKHRETKSFAEDLIAYMREHSMLERTPIPEIYAREINNAETLTLFLQVRIYCCDFERNSRLGQTLYFAPHFGKRIVRMYPGIERGISYIARIANVVVVDSWKDFLERVKDERGQVFARKYKQHMTFIKKWPWTKQRRNIVFLEEPRLVFNPPVKKEHLQAGRGWLSKNYLSFDDLFKAWNYHK